jgi:hypothetical protein
MGAVETPPIEQRRKPRPLLAIFVIVLAVSVVWAATALASGGSSAPAKPAPSGDGKGAAFVKDRAGATRHDGSGHDGNCPGRARSGGSGTGASQV